MQATYLAGTSRSVRSEGFGAFAKSDARFTTDMFVHDYVGVDLAFGTLVGAFAHFVSSKVIGQLVLEAWLSESAALERAVAPKSEVPAEPSVFVAVGTPRARRDALVLPVLWRSDSPHWIPPLEADLEAVAFGPNRSHLHVLGVSHLAAGVQPCSDRASMEQRLTVAIVRHVLFALAEKITSEVSAQQL